MPGSRRLARCPDGFLNLRRDQLVDPASIDHNIDMDFGTRESRTPSSVSERLAAALSLEDSSIFALSVAHIDIGSRRSDLN